MGKRDGISDQDRVFITAQHLFFVATAPRRGRINLSPKGLDSLRVLSPTRVCWLNLTGSGNETAAHLLDDGRMTLMFCAFSGPPNILRLYGTARAVHPGEAEWDALSGLFPETPGARQVIDMAVDRVQTSCGYSVPLMDYVKDREILTDWADKQGPEGVKQYWEKHNRESVDGLPTGMD